MRQIEQKVLGGIVRGLLKANAAVNLVCIFVNDIIESQKKQGAWVAELVDARDLKSLGACLCTSSILVPGTNKDKGFSRIG